MNNRELDPDVLRAIQEGIDQKWERKAREYRAMILTGFTAVFLLGFGLGAYTNDKIRAIDKKK